MNDSPYSRTIDDVRTYLSKRYDLFLVRTLEKASRIIGLVITLVVVLFLASIAVIFAGIASAYILAQWLPLWGAYLIIGGVFVVLLIMACIFRKQWFINPIVRTLSTILFTENQADSSKTDPQAEKGEKL